MDEESRKEFDRITSLPPEALSQSEIDFLYARRTYFNKSDRNEYGHLMKIKNQQVADAAAADEENTDAPTNPKNNSEDNKQDA